MAPTDRIEGLLFGCAVGDSIGLPGEGLSKERIRRRWNGCWRQRLVLGRGMISDDTEHTMMVADCLTRCGGDVEVFRRMLAWKLRLWFTALPPGIGLATVRACLKLWMGFSPRSSGVWSAGNGPAMRSAVIGAFFHDRPDEVENYVRASTEMTHSDPRALTGALAIARCAASVFLASGAEQSSQGALMDELRRCGEDSEWLVIMDQLSAAITDRVEVNEFANRIGAGRGVSGYIYQTVPVAIFAWLRHRNDFRAGVESVLNCGGDTDTVGAITGSLLGLECGVEGMPGDWVNHMIAWPCSHSEVSKTAECFSGGSTDHRLRFWWLKQLGKNVVMLPVVLVHGFARLFR